MNQNLKERAAEAVREVLRDGRVFQGKEILELVPDLVSSVRVSQSAVQKAIVDVLKDNSRNPLNSVLSLLGFQLVRISKLEGGGTSVVSTGRSLDNMLEADEQKLKDILRQITKILSEHERESEGRSAGQEERYGRLQRELDQERQNLDRQTQENQNYRNLAAFDVQYMLCLLEKQRNDPLYQQLIELLADLDMTAIWPEDETSLSKSALFTAMKSDDWEQRKTKPCIMSDGQVLAKGVYFVAVD